MAPKPKKAPAAEPAAEPSGWRAVLPPHPACDMFPRLDDAELAALAADIKANGGHPINPPAKWTDPAGKTWLMDGRSRFDAMELAGLPVVGKDGLIAEPCEELDPETDPWAYVASANIHRRHLTMEARKGLAERLLKEAPHKSNRAIAKAAKVDPKTAATLRAGMEARGEITHTEERTDATGRQQPARKPRVSEVVTITPGPRDPVPDPEAVTITPGPREAPHVSAPVAMVPAREQEVVADKLADMTRWIGAVGTKNASALPPEQVETFAAEVEAFIAAARPKREGPREPNTPAQTIIARAAADLVKRLASFSAKPIRDIPPKDMTDFWEALEKLAEAVAAMQAWRPAAPTKH